MATRVDPHVTGTFTVTTQLAHSGRRQRQSQPDLRRRARGVLAARADRLVKRAEILRRGWGPLGGAITWQQRRVGIWQGSLGFAGSERLRRIHSRAKATELVTMTDDRQRAASLSEVSALSRTASLVALGFLLLAGSAATSWAGGAPGGAQTEAVPNPSSILTPEEKMSRRFPQKVRVGDLIGLPMLDYDDRTMGRVTEVVRTSDGKIRLISTCCGYFDWNRHQVAVPIETVAILGRQIDVLDISREDFFKLASWTSGEGTQLGPDETIRIAISRR